MNIIKHTFIPEHELLAKLRLTKLRGFDQAEVYKDSTMEISNCFIHNLIPCQNYVLDSTIKDILDLYYAFLLLGVDIFRLKGAILFWLEGSNPDSDPPIPFLPPIIERSYEKSRSVWLINDGMHRIYAASTVGRMIHTVLITQVPSQFPYYAYPLENGWSDVYVVKEVPPARKAYRNPDDYKALFRDFNAVFEGVQKKRT